MKNVSRQNKVPIKKLLLIMGILLLLISFYNIDRSRVGNNEYPLFAMNIKALDDGGSRYYLGVGYGAIAWKIPATRNDGGLLLHGFNVGKEIVGFPECYAALVSDSLSPGIRLEFVESDR